MKKRYKKKYPIGSPNPSCKKCGGEGIIICPKTDHDFPCDCTMKEKNGKYF